MAVTENALPLIHGSRPARSKLKAVFFRLLLVLVAVALTGLAGEVFLRIFYPCPRYDYTLRPPQRGFFIYDALLGWKGKPDAKGPFASRDFHVHVTHNELGHRSSVPPFDADKRNVLILGDSYGWGWGVEDREVFAEQMMRRRRDLHVYNLSAPGYGPDHQYLVLKEFVKTPADEIILLMCLNDFSDVAHDYQYGYPKPMFVLQDGELVLTNVPVPASKEGGMKRSLPRADKKPWARSHRRLHLFNLLNNRAKAFQIRGLHDVPTEEERARMPLLFRLLDEIAGLCKSRGAGFRVVLIQNDDEGNWRWPLLRQHLADSNIRCSDFRVNQSWRQEILWLDGHLNAYGHRLLARHILEDLRATESAPSIRP